MLRLSLLMFFALLTACSEPSPTDPASAVSTTHVADTHADTKTPPLSDSEKDATADKTSPATLNLSLPHDTDNPPAPSDTQYEQDILPGLKLNSKQERKVSVSGKVFIDTSKVDPERPDPSRLDYIESVDGAAISVEIKTR